VIAHYHKYMAQNDLVKTVIEEAPAAAAAPTSIAAPPSAIEAPPTQTPAPPAETADTPAEPHVRMVAGGNP
jgi:hypothetical protein